jgi:hypothetical protein
MRGKGKTYRVSRLIVNLVFTDLPNFGPYGTLSGMRKYFWGYDCDVVKQGTYHYKINIRHGEGPIFNRLKQIGIAGIPSNRLDRKYYLEGMR